MIQRESYSYPADCWSLGIIVHQMLTLERPFDGSSTAELVKSILTCEPPPIGGNHYSEELKSISRLLLLKSPTERLSMFNLLSDSWFFNRMVNFTHSYRPKYLEERIRRSHVKQLESQIEFITNKIKYNRYQQFQQQQALYQQQQQQLMGDAGGATATKPAGGTMSRQSSFRNNIGNNSNTSNTLQIPLNIVQNSAPNTARSTSNLNDRPGFGAGISGGGGYGSNSGSHGDVMHISNLDVLPALLETLNGSFDASASEKVSFNHRCVIIDDPDNPSQAAADAEIDIIDGVYGNEQFMSVNIKITSTNPSPDKSIHSHQSHGSIATVHSDFQDRDRTHSSSNAGGEKTVVELHYSTEIKLPGGHHHHHNNHATAMDTDDASVGQKNDREGEYQAIIRQSSVSLINGEILDSSVDEIITKVNSMDLNELTKTQFQRIRETIKEEVKVHTNEIRRSYMNNAIIQQEAATAAALVDGTTGIGAPAGQLGSFEGDSEVRNSFKGGRIGERLATAIENDHAFEKELTSHIITASVNDDNAANINS
jgi:serine/threonine protein kinase